jgi:hypothetical protein
MWSPEICDRPDEFDAYRYVRLQAEPNWATKSRFVNPDTKLKV